jgi:hypothetical protein
MRFVLFVVVLLFSAIATPVAPAPAAPLPALGVHPRHVRFGRQPYESNTLRSFHIRNRSRATLLVTVEQVRVGDDFSPGQVQSTCTLGDTLLAPGQTCTHVVGFRPSEFFGGHETALMRVTARDDQGRVRYNELVRLSGTGYEP